MTARVRGSIGTFLARATSNDVVSAPFFVITLVFSLLNHFGSSGGTAYGSALLRAVAVLIGTTALIIVLIVWWFALVTRLRGTVRIIVGIAGFALAATTRALVLQSLLVRWGLSDLAPQTLFIRFINGTFTIATVMLVTAYVVTTTREYRRRMAALESELDQLSTTLDESSRIVADQQADAIDRVQRMLTAQLEGLPVDSADGALGSMQSLVGDVVRPMSHELARSVPTYQPVALTEDDTRIRWSRVWAGLSLDGAIRPGLTTVVVIVLGLPGALRLYGPGRGALTIAVAAAVGALALITVRRVAARPIQRARPAARAIGLVLALLAAAIPVGIATAIVSGPGPDQFFYTPSALVTIPVVGMLLAVAHAVREQMSAVDDRLSEVSTDLRWAVARSHMVKWRQQRELSSALHGPVQSALHAAMMRLRSAVESGRANPEFIAQMRDQVRVSLVELLSVEAGRIDLAEELDSLVEIWNGIATIDATIETGAQAQLERDSICAAIVGDITQDAVSNAVRHGQASHVELQIVMDGPSRVRLTVVADGQAGSASAGAGLGTAMLVDCSVSWHREVDGTGSRLEAVLPLDPVGAPVPVGD